MRVLSLDNIPCNWCSHLTNMLKPFGCLNVSLHLFKCTVTGVTLSKEVRSGAPALRVTWDSPQSDVDITHYEVQYRSAGTQWMNAPTITVSPPTTTTHLEGLQAGTSYSVRVRAVSNGEEGEWSNNVEETTFDSESSGMLDNAAHQ